MISLAFLLLVQAAMELPRSPLVADNHIHQWTQIGEVEGDTFWLDTALAETIEHEARMYPVVMLRAVEQKGDGFEDFKFGVDCERSELAAFDGWTQGHTAEESKREGSETLHFFRPATIAAPVFRHACGPEWRYTPQL